MLSYDQLNRLTAATGNAFTEQGITYDKNGNIKSLQRTANNLTIENLSYTYSGNKLSSVNESVTGGMTSTYTYDANGNLAADSKKALNFSYNFLNLMQAVGTTNYCYAADGTKLAVRDASGNGFAYLGSLILSPSSTEFQFADGVIRKTTSGYEVNYFLRDHLGSVRTVVNTAGEVVQQSDYYPFGSKQENATYVNNSNRFLYNSKELQTTGGLGFLDYGARMYDAKLGRWFVQDPMSEKYHAFSPYNYVLNNPFRFIDPTGCLVEDPEKGIKLSLSIKGSVGLQAGFKIGSIVSAQARAAVVEGESEVSLIYTKDKSMNIGTNYESSDIYYQAGADAIVVGIEHSKEKKTYEHDVFTKVKTTTKKGVVETTKTTSYNLESDKYDKKIEEEKLSYSVGLEFNLIFGFGIELKFETKK